MAASDIATHSLLVLAAATLFYAALTDLKQYKIRNELIFVLVGLFLVHAVVSGRWISIHWNVGAVAVILAVTLYFYAKKMMGGGDVKILAVGFLWVGVDCALPLAVLLVIFATIHTILAKLRWVDAQHVDGRMRIPFAPSVAAALIGCFMLGCLKGAA